MVLEQYNDLQGKNINPIHKNSMGSLINVQWVEKRLNVSKETTKKRIILSLIDFCKNSTIHGIRYFVERCHLIERIWWIMAFGLSVYLCIALIYTLLLKWRESPVIVSFDHKAMSIQEVPFPAVTLCPVIKASANKFNYTRVYRSMFKLDGEQSQAVTDDELKIMKVFGQLCDDFTGNDVNNFFPDNFTDDSILTTFKSILPKLEDTMLFCKLFDKWTRCEKFLFPMITEEGICYTFNALNIKEMITNETYLPFLNMTFNEIPSNWDYENGYDEPKDTEPYPYRVFGTGKHASLSLLMRIITQDEDYLCGGALQGFRVAFHAPNERPQVWKNFFHVSPKRSVLFTISPNLMITSLNVRDYSPDVRQCYFNSERKLRYFLQYTQRNCELECMSNFTAATCGCVRFSMPRSADIRICGPARIRCCNKAENMIFANRQFDACNCLPSCTTVSYEVDTSQADFDLLSSWSRSKFQQIFDFENSTFSRVVVSFKEEHFVASKRSEFRNLTDFLANSGGLFGLFMGASLLSFVELIYYFTLRIFYMKKDEQVIEYRAPQTQKRQTRIFTILP